METSTTREGIIKAMGAPRKYPDELRERATRMALEALADPDRSHGASVRVAEQLGVHREALRTWVRKAQAEGQDASSVSADRDARLAQLEKENRELRRANTILKQASAFFASRSWTVHSAEGRVHRPPQGRTRCLADLRRPGRDQRRDRAFVLLRRQDPPAIGAVASRRRTDCRDHHYVRGELPRVRRPEDVPRRWAAPATRSPAAPSNAS